MTPDTEGMARLGIDAQSTIGVHISECGFEPYERDDGLNSPTYDPQPDYNDYLRRQGYNGDNPWHSWVNSGTNDDGDLLSGWFLNNSDRPARVPDEHSETPYMTNRAIDLLRETLDDPTGQPWLCHLSYIKPHWPDIVPAPYHDMYGIDDMQPPVLVIGIWDEDDLQEKLGYRDPDDPNPPRMSPHLARLLKEVDSSTGNGN